MAKEILVVVSKLKQTVKSRVSGDVPEVLSAHIKDIMKRAEEIAGSESMATVKDRHVTAALQAYADAKAKGKEE